MIGRYVLSSSYLVVISLTSWELFWFFCLICDNSCLRLKICAKLCCCPYLLFAVSQTSFDDSRYMKTWAICDSIVLMSHDMIMWSVCCHSSIFAVSSSVGAVIFSGTGFFLVPVTKFNFPLPLSASMADLDHGI